MDLGLCYETFQNVNTKYFCTYFHSEAEDGTVWYYSTVVQFEELCSVLDKDEMEAPLYREIVDFKPEICRQMELTEKLTNQLKGGRKSYLEIENATILRLQKERADKKEEDDSKMDLDKKDDMSDDPNVVDSEVTISASGETTSTTAVSLTDDLNTTVAAVGEEEKDDTDVDTDDPTAHKKSGKNIVTRSKTGSLTPRTFNDDGNNKLLRII